MTTLHFKAFDQVHTVFIEKIMNQQEIHAYLSDICSTFVLLWWEYDCTNNS
jgi:hypothetical protein